MIRARSPAGTRLRVDAAIAHALRAAPHDPGDDRGETEEMRT